MIGEQQFFESYFTKNGEKELDIGIGNMQMDGSALKNLKENVKSRPFFNIAKLELVKIPLRKPFNKPGNMNRDAADGRRDFPQNKDLTHSLSGR
jgi:hypothetical protein